MCILIKSRGLEGSWDYRSGKFIFISLREREKRFSFRFKLFFHFLLLHSFCLPPKVLRVVQQETFFDTLILFISILSFFFSLKSSSFPFCIYCLLNHNVGELFMIIVTFKHCKGVGWGEKGSEWKTLWRKLLFWIVYRRKEDVSETESEKSWRYLKTFMDLHRNFKQYIIFNRPGSSSLSIFVIRGISRILIRASNLTFLCSLSFHAVCLMAEIMST